MIVSPHETGETGNGAIPDTDLVESYLRTRGARLNLEHQISEAKPAIRAGMDLLDEEDNVRSRFAVIIAIARRRLSTMQLQIKCLAREEKDMLMRMSRAGRREVRTIFGSKELRSGLMEVEKELI
jgi:hypothetical protein